MIRPTDLFSFLRSSLGSGALFWWLVVATIALLIMIPVVYVGASLFTDQSRVWQQLLPVMGEYVLNSWLLMVGVGAGVLVLGVITGWLVAACDFPGRRWLEWGLLMPLAAPAYLLAYTYTNLLDYYGPVQSWLRFLFHWQEVTDYWFPNIRSLGGAIIMFIFVLYPYVYLLARTSFLEQGLSTLEASRSLGCNPWQSFWRVALPLARPAIATGVALVLMETLNDFGTVQYFGVNTFTTGIYNTWFGLGEQQGAAQLAACLLVLIAGLVGLELYGRHRVRYYQNHCATSPLPRYCLGGGRGWSALALCLLPLLLGFIVPAVYLLYLALVESQDIENNNFWQLASHSLILASTTALLAIGCGLILAYGQRLMAHPVMTGAVRLAAGGYALPGSLIAVGVLIPAGYFDNALDSWMQRHWQISTGLLLSGTITLLIYAYLVRFLAVAFGALESSLQKIKPSLDDAARSLGHSPLPILMKIHIPLLSGGLLTALMLVFVDVMKELPATLVIRPFNFDTLAVRVYQYASDERLVEAAAPAIAILAVGLIPVVLLSLQMSQSRPLSHL